MNKTAIRLVALVLVPCLLADSVSRSAFAYQIPATTSARQNPFPEQALTLFTDWIHPYFRNHAARIYRWVGNSSRHAIRVTGLHYDDFYTDTDDSRLKQGASGVRASMGGTQENPRVNPNYLLAIAMYSYFYALDRFKSLDLPSDHPLKILIAGDPRPSTQLVRDAVQKGLQAAAKHAGRSIEALHLGILTTPITESAVRSLHADGAVMITASHNPFKDNGVKFMTAANEERGALLSSKQMGALKARFSEIRRDPSMFAGLYQELSQVSTGKSRPGSTPPVAIDPVLEGYVAELRGVFEGTDLNALLHQAPVIIDPNGGAGAIHVNGNKCGVLAWVLKQFGMKVFEINNMIGNPRHSLEPKEGSDGLLQMEEMVAQLAQQYPSIFGMVTDPDADRGTTAPQMDPQTVAAFNIAMRLSWMDAYHKADNKKVVLVVSDSTSKRAELIAQLFSKAGRPVEVRRVETGEINVVSAMQEERRKGHYVPLGVEGSNGGSIFGESTCRDGLATVLMAALALRDPKIKEEWAKHAPASSQIALKESTRSLTLVELARSLPGRYTHLGQKTDVGVSMSFLKQGMENELRNRWVSSPELQQAYPQYRFHHYEEMTVHDHVSEDGKGGWVLALAHANGEEDYIWLRPSGTEPIVRYQVDAAEEISLGPLLQLFEALYQSANNPDHGGSVSDNGQIIFEDGISFSLQHDAENDRWENSRIEKRFHVLQRFPFAWAVPADPFLPPQAIQSLLTKLVERRRRWYESEINPADPDYETFVSREWIRDDTQLATLQFCIDEMLANAFDAYTRKNVDHGQILIRVQLYADKWVLDVSDNGVGIRRIFQDPVGAFLVYSNPAMFDAPSAIEGGKGHAIPWIQILSHLHRGSLQFFSPGVAGYRTTARMIFPRDAIKEETPSVDLLHREQSDASGGAPLGMVPWLGKAILWLTRRWHWPDNVAVFITTLIEFVFFGGGLVLFLTGYLRSTYSDYSLERALLFSSSVSMGFFILNHLWSQLFYRNKKTRELEFRDWPAKDWLALMGWGVVFRVVCASLFLLLLHLDKPFGAVLILPLVAEFGIHLIHNLTTNGPLAMPGATRPKKSAPETKDPELISQAMTEKMRRLRDALFAAYASNPKIPDEGPDGTISVPYVLASLQEISSELNLRSRGRRAKVTREESLEFARTINALKKKFAEDEFYEQPGLFESNAEDLIENIRQRLVVQASLAQKYIKRNNTAAVLALLTSMYESIALQAKTLKKVIREPSPLPLASRRPQNWFGETPVYSEVNSRFIRFTDDGRVWVWRANVYRRVQVRDEKFTVSNGQWIPYDSLSDALRAVNEYTLESGRDQADEILPYLAELDIAEDMLGRDISRVLSVADYEVCVRLIADVAAWAKGVRGTARVQARTRTAENLNAAIEAIKVGTVQEKKFALSMVRQSITRLRSRAFGDLIQIRKAIEHGKGRELKTLAREEEQTETSIRKILETYPKTLAAQRTWLNWLEVLLERPASTASAQTDVVRHALFAAAREWIKKDEETAPAAQEAYKQAMEIWNGYKQSSEEISALSAEMRDWRRSRLDKVFDFASQVLVTNNTQQLAKDMFAQAEAWRMASHTNMAGVLEKAAKMTNDLSEQKELFGNSVETRYVIVSTLLNGSKFSLSVAELPKNVETDYQAWIDDILKLLDSQPYEKFQTAVNAIYPPNAWPKNLVQGLKQLATKQEDARLYKKQTTDTMEAIRRDVLRALDGQKNTSDTPPIESMGGALATEIPEQMLRDAREKAAEGKWAEAQETAMEVFEACHLVIKHLSPDSPILAPMQEITVAALQLLQTLKQERRKRSEKKRHVAAGVVISVGSVLSIFLRSSAVLTGTLVFCAVVFWFWARSLLVYFETILERFGRQFNRPIQFDDLPHDKTQFIRRIRSLDKLWNARAELAVEREGARFRDEQVGILGYTSMGASYGNIALAMQRYAAPIAGKHVLEVGPGPGFFQYILSRCGVFVEGLEYNPQFVTMARLRGLTATQGSLLSPPKALLRTPHDVIIGHLVLDALNTDGTVHDSSDTDLGRKALKALHDLAPPNGIIIQEVERGFPFGMQDVLDAGLEYLAGSFESNFLVFRRPPSSELSLRLAA